MVRKEYDINFLPYCTAMYKQWFETAAAELEQLVMECRTISQKEWWAQRENIPLAAARAYDAYILVLEQLQGTKYVEKVYFDEGMPRVKTGLINISDSN